MLKIGITGGIGSGKTTVCRIFETLNIAIYYSDKGAKELMESNLDLKAKLRLSFGDQIFDSNGNLITFQLASTVFSDQQKLKSLNNLVHPFVLDDFSDWCVKHSGDQYIIFESAIIFESNIAHLLDYVVIVDAPTELRIQRITERDNISRDDVLQRMNNQFSSDEKKSMSKLIINNDGKQSLIDQVMHLHSDFSRL